MNRTVRIIAPSAVNHTVRFVAEGAPRAVSSGLSGGYRGMTTTRFKVSGGNDARVKELRGILERDPLNVNQRFMLAQALESDGKLADAVKELGVAIEKGRRNLGVAHCNYAMGLMKIN